MKYDYNIVLARIRYSSSHTQVNQAKDIKLILLTSMESHGITYTLVASYICYPKHIAYIKQENLGMNSSVNLPRRHNSSILKNLTFLLQVHQMSPKNIPRYQS